MEPLAALASLALATRMLAAEGAVVRTGCEAGDRAVARLQGGESVEVRFAVTGETGTCYKVAVRRPEGTIEGYIPRETVMGVEAFERQRRNAPRSDGAVWLGRAEADPGTHAVRLIEQHRPGEALEILEAALRRDRTDTGLLALAGFAAYRNDEVQRAIDLWKAAVAQRANPAIERMLATAEREAREDKSAERLVGMRFLLRYNRNQMEADTAREALAILDQEYARVSAELGCRTEERIVAIAQSPEEYRRTTDAAEWGGGLYNGRIRVAVLEGQRLGEQTREALAHEVVHACLSSLGDYPVWLHEGLAQRLSGRRLPAEELARVKKLARSGELPKLSNLSQPWARMSATHAAAAYQAALAAVDLFYEHHVALGIRNLLGNPHLLAEITEDLDRRLHQ
jgi:tetratricopeptide (TPR) repeat protein